MKHDFSDRASFLKAMTGLGEATFHGRDLAHDPGSRTLTFTLTRADESRGGVGSFMTSRRRSFIRTLVTVRRIASYKQYLAGGPDDVYVLDRAEVGRAGQEIAFYFRPGDRAVMDVDAIDGFVEDAGRVTSAPRKPVIQNPLARKDREAAAGRSIAARLLGRRAGRDR